ncbi:MAG: flavodoxin family protein [bacterium]
MKKVLALIGSYRKLGNCEMMAKEIFRHIPEDACLSLIRLTKLNIQPCKACYACLYPDVYCKIKDDLQFVLESIRKADGVIVAIPVYCFGPAAIFKMVVDRSFEFMKVMNEIRGKPCVVVVAAGVRGMEGYTEAAVNSGARTLGLKVKDTATVIGAAPGEIFKDAETLKQAQRLGMALLDEDYKKQTNSDECPFCFSNTFRIAPERKLQCACCGNLMQPSLVNNNIHLTPAEGNRSILTSREYAVEHFHWLVQKKGEYEREKDELNKIRKQYKEIGEWLTP